MPPAGSLLKKLAQAPKSMMPSGKFTASYTPPAWPRKSSCPAPSSALLFPDSMKVDGEPKSGALVSLAKAPLPVLAGSAGLTFVCPSAPARALLSWAPLLRASGLLPSDSDLSVPEPVCEALAGVACASLSGVGPAEDCPLRPLGSRKGGRFLRPSSLWYFNLAPGVGFSPPCGCQNGKIVIREARVSQPCQQQLFANHLRLLARY